ncbi:MAG: DUF192 domain-containing protein [Thiobacillus sp.]|nr:DUF192 domain-containing protein [Thiobacillus sp.]MDP2979344.1 DUF192 domain-containing protein [Thiobacillus sp.]
MTDVPVINPLQQDDSMSANATRPNSPPRLAIRLADGFFSRLAGLLFSPPLQPGHGLLLVPCAAVHTAFMRYAIDVVFLDRAGKIRRIVPRLVPWRTAAFPGAYQTLELAAGEAARLGLQAGQPLAQGLSTSTPEKLA